MKIFIYIVGIITTIIIIIITLPNIIITRSEPYRYSLSLLQKNTDVKVYLGDNYSHVGLARGSIRYSSKSNSGFDILDITMWFFLAPILLIETGYVPAGLVFFELMLIKIYAVNNK